jgi:porphobilinogen synthase
MLSRPRRNRKSAGIRLLTQENAVMVEHLIFPIFITEGSNQKVAISSMPGIFRFSLDILLEEISECMSLGINAFCLFPHYPEQKKDKLASESWNESGLYLNAIRKIKKQFPEIVLMTDVAMDPYSSDGHDGLVEDGKILNDESRCRYYWSL